MDEQDRQTLEGISVKLDRIIVLLEAANKPETKARRFLKLVGEIMAILSALSIADVVRNWIVLLRG